MATVDGIKKLRAMTGCGMLDCKKALEASSEDLEAAVLWLRKHGMTKAAKKADRETLEGAVGVVTDGTWGALIQIASETDFVARNERFGTLMQELLEVMQQNKGTVTSVEQFLKTAMPKGHTVEEELNQAVGVIGEALRLIDVKVVEVSKGLVGSYLHNAYAPHMGKIGVLVGLSSEGEPTALAELGKHVAMHVAASNPLALTKEELDASVVEKERTAYTEEAKTSGKPAAAMEKIVEGRMSKFFKGSVLQEQPFIMDEAQSVHQAVQAKGASVDAFAMLKVG
jgi:elongation factor Ts